MGSTINWLPIGLYHFMADIAYKNGISIKEVELTLLRHACREMDFECDHKDVHWSKPKKPKDRPAYAKTKANETRPYCFNCQTFMEVTKEAQYDWQGNMTKPAEYYPKRNFHDEFLKAQREKKSEVQERTLREVTD